MSEENSPPIDKEPVANGNSKLSIELPTNEKKELEIVVKNEKQVAVQPVKKYGEQIAGKRVNKNDSGLIFI